MGNTLTPTSEVGGSNPGPYVGQLVVAYDAQRVRVQNLHQLVCTRLDAGCTLSGSRNFKGFLLALHSSATLEVLGLDLYSLSGFVVTKNVSNYSAE